MEQSSKNNTGSDDYLQQEKREVSKMSVTTFHSRDESPLNKDVAGALTEVERLLCAHFEHIETCGKRGRKVPVILTPVMVETLELLIKERCSCGVSEGNIYLFARPGYDTHFHGE